MTNIMKKFEEELLNATSALDYKMAYNELVNSLENDELDYQDVDLESYKEIFKKYWTMTPISTSEKTEEKKEGDKTIKITKTIQNFKRPELSVSNLERLSKALIAIKIKQEADKVKEEMINKLSNQPKATRKETGAALKAILFNSKVNNTYTNIRKILNWINQVKNFSVCANNKSLFYMSNQADGTVKGGNGKSWIINALREALNDLSIPNCSRTLPTWHDSEITNDFANNVVSFAEEQSFCLPHSPTYDIMDKSSYQTRIKYQPSVVLKSICNIIGSTNETLSKTDQTLRRRLDIIYCNENQVIDELDEEQKQQIPTQYAQIAAWKYLLTHDLTVVYPQSKDATVSVSNEEREVLWELVNWQSDCKNIYNSTTIVLRTLKDTFERNNKKISYTTSVHYAKKYGAVVIKKGSHGREAEGDSMIDISNMNIPLDIFADDSNFTLPEVYKLIDNEYNDTDPTDPSNETPESIDELLSKIDGLEDYSNNNEQMKLYDTINESNTSYKDVYYTTPTNNEDDQFELINPLFDLASTRSDANTESRRNFVFECDDISLDEQKTMVKELIEGNIINRAVYSGGKSIHCRITINYEPVDKEEYKYIFHYLNDLYFSNHADKACSNPARLTRKPNGIRINGKKQLLIYKSDRVLDVAHLHKSFLKEAHAKKIDREMKAMLNNLGYKPKKYDTISETLENMKKKSGDGYEATIACLEGNATYEEGIRALSYCKWLGFTYEEIIGEIDFGSWNFRDQFYDGINA